jgi:hypothetical protein
MVHGMIVPGMPVLHVMMLVALGRPGCRSMVMGVLIRHVIMMLHPTLMFVTFVTFRHRSTSLPDSAFTDQAEFGSGFPLFPIRI